MICVGWRELYNVFDLPPPHPHVCPRTCSHWAPLIRGFPELGHTNTHTHTHTHTVTSSLRLLLLNNLKKNFVWFVSFAFFKSFASDLLLPIIHARYFMASVSRRCHGNAVSCSTLHFLPTLPEIQPPLPIGCERLEDFRLSPSDVHSTQFKPNSLSLCSWGKLSLSTMMLVPLSFTGCPPPPSPLAPPYVEYDSVSPPLYSPPQNSPQSLSACNHITVSLLSRFIFSSLRCLFQEGCRRLRLTLHDQSQAARSTEQPRDKVRTSCV